MHASAVSFQILLLAVRHLMANSNQLAIGDGHAVTAGLICHLVFGVIAFGHFLLQVATFEH